VEKAELVAVAYASGNLGVYTILVQSSNKITYFQATLLVYLLVL
jgi:hypothetical protein